MSRHRHPHVLRSLVCAILALSFLPWVTPASPGAAQTAPPPSTVWTHVDTLTADDPASAEYFGAPVKIDGDTVMLGDAAQDVGGVVDRGAVYVFTRAPGTDDWVQTGKLSAGGASARFGTSIDIDGTTAVIGSPQWGAAVQVGQAFVYESAGDGSWNFTQSLPFTPPEFTTANFGAAVGIDGEYMISGAPADHPPARAGSVRLYHYYEPGHPDWQPNYPTTKIDAVPQWQMGSFGQYAALDDGWLVGGNGTAGGPGLGRALFFYNNYGLNFVHYLGFGNINFITIDLEGEWGAAGYRSHLVAGAPGQVEVLRRTTGSWGRSGPLSTPHGENDDNYGAVAIENGVLYVGASRADVGGVVDAGAVYVYELVEGAWTLVDTMHAPTPQTDGWFGRWIDVKDGVLVVGGNNIAHVYSSTSPADASTITVDAVSDEVWLSGFAPSSIVDLDVGGTAHQVSTDANGDGYLDLLGLIDVVPGMVVSDLAGGSTHTVTPLAFTAVVDGDPFDSVVGTAVGGSEVCVVPFGQPEECVTTDGAAPDIGTWTWVDAGQVGAGSARQYDADGDSTQVHWGDTWFLADRFTDVVWGHGWRRNATVTISVGGTEVATAPTDPSGYFDHRFDPATTDLDVGTVVTVADGTSSKSHSLTAVRITEVDSSADVVRGTAAPLTELRADVHGVDDVGRTVLVDSNGDWEADFSVPGDGGATFDIEHWTTGYVHQFDHDGDATHDAWWELDSRITANVGDDWVQGHGWSPDTNVTLTVGGGDPIVLAVDGDGWTPYVDLSATGLDPGVTITVADRYVTKTLVTTNPTITSVDPVENTVAGTAGPNAELWVDVHGSNAGRVVVADAGGNWSTDFDDVGDHGETADLVPGDEGSANECDADTDCTQVHWRIPNPTVSVDPRNEGLWGNEFTPLATVAVTVDGTVAPGSPFATDEWGNFGTGFDPNDLDLAAGQLVVASDTTITKDHTITNLAVTSLDHIGNVVVGTADAGTDVFVDIHGLPDVGRTVTADGGGVWSADLDVPGDGGGTFDLQPGTSGYANQCDAENDCTHVDWHVPDPRISVDLNDHTLWGNDFEPLSTVAVTADAVAVPGSPFPTDHWGNFNAWFDPAELDLVAGVALEATDGTSAKDHTITNLVVTTIDPVTNVVAGTADPGTDVRVNAHHGPWEAARTVTADVSGNWTTDFDDPGEGGMTHDLEPGDPGDAHQCDADNDCTFRHWRIPNPNFQVDPRGSIWANEFAPEGSIAITIDGADAGSYPLDPWGSFDSNNAGLTFDVPAGSLVAISDGITTKDHTVTALAVTLVDADANVVAGTADPGSELFVGLHSGPWEAGRGVTADSTGYWSTDFDDPGDNGATHDLGAGDHGAVSQCDADGDCTNVNWNVANPTITASVSHEEIWADGWPEDPDGQLLYWQLDDPLTPEIDHEGDMPLLVTPWGTEAGDRSFGTYDVQAGQVLTVRNRPFGDPLDGGLERVLHVSNLVVTEVDADSDRISGTADPAEGGYLCVYSNDAQLCSDQPGFAWADGTFVADFGSVGSDVRPGHWNEASQFDDDGDRTHFWWNLPPWVVVNLAPEDETGAPRWPDEVRAESWVGPIVTLTINGTFVADITVSGHEHDQTTIELPGLDIEPGDVVTLTDGTDTKTVVVDALGIDHVNFSTDDPPNTIQGTATLERDVRVEISASVGGRWAERWVRPDSGGTFLADFGNPGNGWREQWTAELGGPQGLGRHVRLEIYDDDNDRTESRHCEGVPRIEVSRFDNQVTVYDYPEGTEVTIEIDDPATPESPDYVATGIALPNPENPCETIIVFDVVDYEIPEQATIVATDGTPEGTVTHDPIPFTLDLVDPDTDRIHGTTAPGVEVQVEANGPEGRFWRYVTAGPDRGDGLGDWVADFSVVPDDPEPGEAGTVDIGPGSNGRAIVLDEFGNSTQLTWHIASANFQVDVVFGQFWANEFEPGGQLTVDVAGTGYGPFGLDEWGNFDGNNVGLVLDVAAGQVVTVADGTTVKDHTVTPLVVTLIDPDGNVIAGTAAPASDVRVDVHSGPWEANRTVTADESGNWSTDFDVPGDGGQTYDFGPGDNGAANQCDDDGDCTQYPWRVANANFQVDPSNEGLWLNEFAPNSEVTVTVDGTGIPGSPFTTDEWGNVGTGFDRTVQDFAAGQTVVASDGAATKDHTITPLVVTLVDPDENVVAGTANPYTEVWVDVHGHGEAGRMVSVNAVGEWDTDFDTPGEGGGTFDIMVGDEGGYAAQCDDDGDCTWINWWASNPTFSVETPYAIWSHAGEEGTEWIVGATATITVDDDGDPSNGTLFDTSVPIEGWGFELTTEPFVIEPGHVVTVSDGETTKTLEVDDVQITLIDQDADAIAGTGPAEEWVEVDVGDHSGGAHRRVFTDAEGNWFADFANPQPDHPETFDIRPDVGGAAQVFDDDQDSTHRGFHVANPQFGVNAEHEWVYGDGWAPIAEVTITIDADDDAGNGVLHTQAATANGDGHFELDVDGFDVQPGQFVTVTDGVSTKTHLVTGIAVTAVDDDADTVSGTATPGAVVDVDVYAPLLASVWEQLVFQLGPGRFDRNPDSLNEHLDFRRAVAHAIDRQALVDAIPGAGYAIDSYVEATVPAISTDAWSQYGYDPALAANLVEQLCIDIGRDCTTNPPVAVFTTTDENPDRALMAALLQPMLAAAGIDLVIDLEPDGVFFGTTIPAGTFDLGEWGFVSEQPSFDGLREAMATMDPEQRWSESLYRWGTPDSAVVDPDTARFAELLGLMHETDDPTALAAYSAEAEQILADQVPFLPLYIRSEGSETEHSPRVTVVADELGNWTADFSGLFDITPGQEGSAAEFDDDGDHTIAPWRAPNPAFAVETPRHIVSGAERTDWIVGSTVDITVDDDDPATGPLFTGTATVVEWGFYLDTDPFVIAPDHVVTVTDGDTTKILTVVDLQVTAVDAEVDTVSGTAPPGAWVALDVWDGVDRAYREVEADAFGNWTADFATPPPEAEEWGTFDLRPGVEGRAWVADEDGDATQRHFVVEPVSITAATLTPQEPMQIGETATLTVELTGSSDRLLVDWGDGSDVEEFDAREGPIVVEHDYSTPGVFTVEVTLTGYDGSEDAVSPGFAVVYDASVGSIGVHGSFGWPVAAIPAVVGEAKVGASAHYQHGVPFGNFKFEFQPADGSGKLQFKEDTVDALVISPSFTYLAGTGTFQGDPTVYTYRLTAIDGDQGGGAGDRVRVVLLDGTTAVWDSQPGDYAGDLPTTALDNGQVQVRT